VESLFLKIIKDELESGRMKNLREKEETLIAMLKNGFEF
jgi:hypothetical protein